MIGVGLSAILGDNDDGTRAFGNSGVSCSRGENVVQGFLGLFSRVTGQELVEFLALVLDVGDGGCPGQEIDDELIEGDAFSVGSFVQLSMERVGQAQGESAHELFASRVAKNVAGLSRANPSSRLEGR